ncbi:unnamed protein product, partial [Heterotrigona itama]
RVKLSRSRTEISKSRKSVESLERNVDQPRTSRTQCPCSSASVEQKDEGSGRGGGRKSTRQPAREADGGRWPMERMCGFPHMCQPVVQSCSRRKPRPIGRKRASTGVTAKPEVTTSGRRSSVSARRGAGHWPRRIG